MRKYPGINELRVRDAAWIASVFVTVPMIALGVMAYLPGPTPIGAWIAIGLLAAIDLVIAGILLFPRTYLVLDAANGVATFVARGTRSEMPIAEIEPLFVRKIQWESRQEQRRTFAWYRVETAAAPVIFYRSTDQKNAARRLQRLNRKLGFSRTAPQKTEYVAPNHGL